MSECGEIEATFASRGTRHRISRRDLDSESGGADSTYDVLEGNLCTVRFHGLKGGAIKANTCHVPA